MKGNGIATVRDGISSYPTDRDIYNVQSSPRDQFSHAERSLPQDLEIMARLQSSGVARKVKAVIIPVCIVLIYPVYLTFWHMPKLMMKKIVMPVVQAVKKVIVPPLNFSGRVIKGSYQVVSRGVVTFSKKVREKGEILKNLIRKPILIVVDGLERQKKKIQLFVSKVVQFICRPIKGLEKGIRSKLDWMRKRIVRATDVPHKFFQEIHLKFVRVCIDKINLYLKIVYLIILKGSQNLNRGFVFLVTCLKVLPRYADYLFQDIRNDLKQWFSSRE